MSVAARALEAGGWHAANAEHLDLHLERLRVLLRAHVHRLRREWSGDSLHGHGGVISDAQADRLLGAPLPVTADGDPEHDAQRAALEAAIAGASGDLAQRGTPAALDVVAHRYELGEFERDVLVLCLAPELDAAFERLYAYAQDDLGRGHATQHLAVTLLGDAAPGHRTLAPGATLRRQRLVRAEPGAPGTPLAARPLVLDERVAGFLRGVNRLDERVAAVLAPVPAAPLAPPHVAAVRELAEWMAAQPPESSPVICLAGPPGAGRGAVARALADVLGLRLGALDPALVPPHGVARDELLRLIERETVLGGLLVYLDAGVRGDGVEALLREVGAPAIVAAPRSLSLASLTVTLPFPDAGAQRALWHTVAPELDESSVDALVQQFDLGPQAVARAASAAAARDPGAALAFDRVWGACREQASDALDGLAQRIAPVAGWDDLVLPDEATRQLRDIGAQVAYRAEVYEAWGFGRLLSRGRGIAVLFCGESGTGKTMAAEVLAGGLDLELCRVDLAGVVSKYIGETEKNLALVFDAAERSGALLFFDEADALFGKRSEVKDSHDRYANIEVDYLLQRMESYRGLAVLATNRKAALDRAFLRRLRFVVDFPFPDAGARRRLWQRAFPSAAPVAALDYGALAQMELTGGSIRTIALNAAFMAAAAATPVGMQQIREAARREYAKLDQLPAMGAVA